MWPAPIPFSTLINLTGRYTAANQTGLTGFGYKDRTNGGPGDSDKKKVKELGEKMEKCMENIKPS